jgi:hypothetical protein
VLRTIVSAAGLISKLDLNYRVALAFPARSRKEFSFSVARNCLHATLGFDLTGDRRLGNGAEDAPSLAESFELV